MLELQRVGMVLAGIAAVQQRVDWKILIKTQNKKTLNYTECLRFTPMTDGTECYDVCKNWKGCDDPDPCGCCQGAWWPGDGGIDLHEPNGYLLCLHWVIVVAVCMHERSLQLFQVLFARRGIMGEKFGSVLFFVLLSFADHKDSPVCIVNEAALSCLG